MELVLVVFIIVVGLSWAMFRKPKSPARQLTPNSPPPLRPRPAPSRPRPVPPQVKPQGHPPIPASLTITGRAYIIDGDTIAVKGTKIRFAGIDAPELNMPWGQKSKWAMVAICKGKTITVKLDGERSYDRLVGTCYLQDGRDDIGAELIKQGLALDIAHFSGGKYRHLEPQGARKKLANGRFGHSSINRVKVC